MFPFDDVIMIHPDILHKRGIKLMMQHPLEGMPSDLHSKYMYAYLKFNAVNSIKITSVNALYKVTVDTTFT